MGQLVPFAQRIKSSVSDHATLAHLFFVIPRRFICAAGALTPTQGTMPLFIFILTAPFMCLGINKRHVEWVADFVDHDGCCGCVFVLTWEHITPI